MLTLSCLLNTALRLLLRLAELLDAVLPLHLHLHFQRGQKHTCVRHSHPKISPLLAIHRPHQCTARSAALLLKPCRRWVLLFLLPRVLIHRAPVELAVEALPSRAAHARR
jgi:hypothetical protein